MPWLTWLRKANAWHPGSEPGASGAAIDPQTGNAEPGPASVRSTGVPLPDVPSLAGRVFVSSTPDMHAEREELARSTLPALQRRFRERGVELLAVDLRRGVTDSEPALDICLAELERCRPWFIGLVGQRLGAVLTQEAASGLRVAGHSLAEIEMLHALADPEAGRRALFFERDPSLRESQEAQAGAGLEESVEGAPPLEELKARIQEVAASRRYAAPRDLGPAVEAALGAALEASFPAAEPPDAYAQADRLHADFARSRLGAYAGGEPHLAALNRWISLPDAPPLIITGPSGAGKSTLIAQWLAAWVAGHPRDIVLAHYLGAGADSADPAALLLRLWEHLDRTTGKSLAPPAGEVELADLAPALARRLAMAALAADDAGAHIIIALDGLERLAAGLDLSWLPQVLPPNVKLLSSSLQGQALRAALGRGWTQHALGPLEEDARRELLLALLRSRGRTLPETRLAQVLGSPLSGLPLFLTTVIEELTAPATDDVIARGLARYLAAPDLPALLSCVLEHREEDCSEALVSGALSLVWAARAGIEESEVIAVTGVTPLAWARLRAGLGGALCEVAGRLTFGHEEVRRAVMARYLATEGARREAHLTLAARLTARGPDARQAQELPYQLWQGQAMEELLRLLLDLDRFGGLLARGAGELSSYWRLLGKRPRDAAGLLCDAFDSRAGQPVRWTEDDLQLAIQLGSFLEHSRASGERVVRLAAKRALACRRLRGPSHPQTLASLRHLARALLGRGDLAGAQKLQEQVLGESTRLPTPQQADAIVDMRALARTLHKRGDLEGAQRQRERALMASARFLGAEHPETLRQMGRLAALLSARGNLDDAQKLKERLLEARLRLAGALHPDTLEQLDSLAVTLSARGDLAGAQRLQERALQGSTRLLGEEHPDTLRALGSLAQTCFARGDLEGARKHQERTLKVLIRVLGPGHPQTLELMGSLAATLLARGSAARARQLMERVLDTRKRLLGRRHPETLRAMSDLAHLLLTRADREGAQKLQERVLVMRRRLLGLRHPDTLRAMSDLARTLLARGDLPGARELQETALEASQQLLGAAHPETLRYMGNLAAIVRATGDLEAAQELQERAVKASVETLGAEHPDTLRAMGSLAGLLASRGDIEAARALQDSVLAASTQLLGPEHPDTLAVLDALAGTLLARGDLEAAQRLQEKLLKASIRQQGPDHPGTLRCINSLATTLRALGDATGEKLQQRVLDAVRRQLGPQHPATLRAMSTLATTLRERGDLAGAQQLLEHVVDLQLRLAGPERSVTLDSMSRLGQVLAARGDLDRAQQLLAHVLETGTQLLGAAHPLTLTAAKDLAANSAEQERRMDLAPAQVIAFGRGAAGGTALGVVPGSQPLPMSYQVSGMRYEVAGRKQQGGAG